MRGLLPALLALAAASPSVAPIQAAAIGDASLRALLPDDCPLWTDVDDDLDGMGVERSLYPASDGGDVQVLTMVEWGFTGEEDPPEGFGLYLYLYDPQGRAWAPRGNVTMAFAAEADSFYDNAFRSMGMTLRDTSDDGLFSKWQVDDARLAYPLVSKSERRYLLGQATLTEARTGESLSFGLGKEFDWTGFPRWEGNDVSTLSMSKTGLQHVRAEVFPFTSDMGGVDGRYGMAWGSVIGVPFRSDVDAFSVAFSLPTWTRGLGTLEEVHYEYWKYRTDWIMGYNDPEDYEAALEYRGVDALDENGDYDPDKVPWHGYAWSAPFDSDDLDVDPAAKYDTHYGFSRFYNNRGDAGHHELRVDNASWVLRLGDDTSEDYRYTSDQLLQYADSYGLDTDPSDDLPVLNGTVSNELFYIPSYSGDGLFSRYGHVDDSVSREDLLSVNFDRVMAERYGYRVPFGQPFVLFDDSFKFLDSSGSVIDSSVYGDQDDLYGFFRAALGEASPEDASLLFGEGSVPLLADLDGADDEVVSRMDGEYRDGYDAFLGEQVGRDVYRLTYDIGLSNSYRCLSGDSTLMDGTWTAQVISASKTDAIFDFRFIDFTFSDGSATYVLPAVSDPFDIVGNPDVPGVGNPGGLSRWLVILLACVAAVIVLVVLSIIFPILKGVLRGLLYVVQFVLDLVYLVLVWWWLALIRKAQGEELPPLWPFGKKV